MELKFKKRQLKIDLYGKEVLLDFPTVGHAKKYEKELNKKDIEEFDVMGDFLADLGMEKEVLNGVETEHLKAIIDALIGPGKK